MNENEAKTADGGRRGGVCSPPDMETSADLRRFLLIFVCVLAMAGHRLASLVFAACVCVCV